MGVYKYKQSIIVRDDLKMPKGKMAAQVAHASMGAVLTFAKHTGGECGLDKEKAVFHYELDVPLPIHRWLSGDFAKIVLKCPKLDDLIMLAEKAKVLNIPYKLIKDNATTVFEEPTVTCIAIGPWDAEVIDSMTKDFKLL
jgi:PTH2 family peptidyl-tRNA hydrolase